MKTNRKGGVRFRLPGRYFPWATYALLCFLACLVTVVLRTVQLSGSINFATGFYNGSSFLMFLLNFFLILFGVLAFFMSWMSHTTYLIVLGNRSHKWLKYLSLILSAAFILQGFFELYEILIKRTRALGPFELLGAATAILSGFGFLFGAFTIQQPRNTSIDVLYALPCLWACVTLISMFVQHTVVITVSENLYNILRMIALVCFLLFSSKFLAGYSDKQNEHWLLFSGLMTVILSAMTTFPLLFIRLFGKQYTVSHVVQAGPVDFILMIYAAAFLVVYLKGRRRIQ